MSKSDSIVDYGSGLSAAKIERPHLFAGSWLSAATHISLSNLEAKKLCFGYAPQKKSFNILKRHRPKIYSTKDIKILNQSCCERTPNRLGASLNFPPSQNLAAAYVRMNMQILLDVGLVIAEVSLDASKVCKAPEHESHSAAPHAAEPPALEAPIAETPVSLTAPLAPTHDAPEVCMMPCNTTYKVEYPTASHEKAAHVLHYISLSILIFFACEVLLLMISLGSLIFSRWIVLVDAVVIGVSIVLDVALHDAAASVIIVVRLWRIVRIVHGIFETVYEKLNDKIESQAKKLKKKKEKIKVLRLQLENLERISGGLSLGVANSPHPEPRSKKSSKKKREKK